MVIWNDTVSIRAYSDSEPFGKKCNIRAGTTIKDTRDFIKRAIEAIDSVPKPKKPEEAVIFSGYIEPKCDETITSKSEELADLQKEFVTLRKELDEMKNLLKIAIS
jgi:hypothetical protein